MQNLPQIPHSELFIAGHDHVISLDHTVVGLSYKCKM